MYIFLTILEKLLPLYAYVLLGYIAGKTLDIKKETVASLLIYVIVPAVVLYGVITTPIGPSTILIPVIFFSISAFLCFLFYYIGGFIWKTPERNILAFAAGNANTGYLGLPVAIALFGPASLGTAVFIMLGVTFCENTVGYFMVSRGGSTMGHAFRRVLKLPALYALLLGLIICFAHIGVHQIILDSLVNFKGAFTVLGMMLIGIGLSSATIKSFDINFILSTFFAKFICYPALISLFIFLDVHYFFLFDTSVHKIMLLMSIVPLASNTVAYATKFRIIPEKVALTVLLSTILALVMIPFFVGYMVPAFF